MPLQKILSNLEQPVNAEVIRGIIDYMKCMPKEKEALVLQCAEHLEKTQSLAAVLAVVHALNEEEFPLKLRTDGDDDLLLDMDLSKEFERIMGSTEEKDEQSPPL